MSSLPWSAREHQAVLDLSYEEFNSHPEWGGRRTWQAYTRRKQYLQKGQIPVGEEPAEVDLTFLSNKKTGSLDWRRVNDWIATGQAIKDEASESQDTSRFYLPGPRPKIMTLGDTHFGSWGTDHKLLQRITDEILSVPDLHIILVGDLAQMAIRLRGVLEVSDNILTPALQHKYMASWLDEMWERIILAGWDNHSVVRQEEAVGFSPIAEILKDKIVYSNGIAHADIMVGEQVYKIAMSHKFRGTSKTNPVYGAQQYLLHEGTDRDIALAGDSHIPGLMKFFIGPNMKLALNCGSTQTNGGFGKRYFSLYTHPTFPVFVLSGGKKLFTPYMSLEECLEAEG